VPEQVRASVVIVQETLPAYRVPLFDEVRHRAADRGLQVSLVHGHAKGARGQRLSTGALPWADVVVNRYLPGPGENGSLVWQPALRQSWAADLVVVEQANRMLLNYALLATRPLGPRVAFWGHGRNMQADPASLSNRLKARLAKAPDWWFAYTQEVADYLVDLGASPDRMTVVGNAIDVRQLRQDVERSREQLAGKPRRRCVFVGGLHVHKRLDVLVGAADLIAARVPDFELVVAGDGEQRGFIQHAAAERPWLRYVGATRGTELAGLLASARLMLLPGLVGLVALDSFAAGVPLVTTADARHSPEFAYLENGKNAVVLDAGLDLRAYADEVVRLLRDDGAWHTLRAGAWEAAAMHSMDKTAERLVQGLVASVNSGFESRRHRH
jgi:glycosyltransferase involved in cell wall biosynthesis